MSLIITEDGKKSQKIDRTPFGLEDSLQEYIHDNPEAIPLYDIKEDIRLLVLVREFPTESGFIDALGIDETGEIYLIETKLYKNQDKRQVVAQVLDYGASLWKTFNSFDDFLITLNKYSKDKSDISIREKIQDFFEISESQVQDILERMRYNLDEGNLKFVILMDNLDDRLKDLIIYLNQNSKFDIYGVELEYYKHKKFEIMIPKLYGAQVKKDVSAGQDTTIFTDEDFIRAFSDIDLEDKIKEIIDFHKQVRNKEVELDLVSAQKTPKYIKFYFNHPNSDSEKDLSIGVGVYEGEAVDTLDFWCYNPQSQDIFIEKLESVLGLETTKIKKGSNYGMIARWPVQKFSSEKLVELFRSLAEEV